MLPVQTNTTRHAVCCPTSWAEIGPSRNTLQAPPSTRTTVDERPRGVGPSSSTTDTSAPSAPTTSAAVVAAGAPFDRAPPSTNGPGKS